MRNGRTEAGAMWELSRIDFGRSQHVVDTKDELKRSSVRLILSSVQVDFKPDSTAHFTRLNLLLAEHAYGEDVAQEADQHRDRRHELLHQVGEGLLHLHRSRPRGAVAAVRVLKQYQQPA